MSALQERMSADIAIMEGSTPLIDAVELVLFDTAAPKKRKNVKIIGKRRKQVKDQTKGNAKTILKNKKAENIVYDNGVDVKSITKLAASKRRGAVSPFSYMAMINKRLPQTVRKNMGAPALENRSGAFASSVTLKDVNVTAQGFPSFGYTYAKNPYQVFEVGTGSAPWSNAQRDPRKLIDRSIREVAAELAIGRFYTRRL